ncbi:MAG: DUF2326 domain-containing protein [Rickettsiales bacterium]|nr:DUF2326 domain-containing protein [Rickettsiales bacterium]
MLITALKSDPIVFDTITFTKGINFITGERSGTTKSGNKTNGVGKSLLLHFIDFCLLGDYKKNRICDVPIEVLSPQVIIILELTCDAGDIVIKRSRQEENTPSLIVNGNLKQFDNLNDAKQFLSKCIFGDNTAFSLRKMLTPFKRKEKEGFNEIDNPSGTGEDIASRIPPYLYLFGIDIKLYKNLEEKAAKLSQVSKHIKYLKAQINELNIPIKDIEAYRNDLKDQVDKINQAVGELSQGKVYDVIADEIAELDVRLEKTNSKLISIREELKKIDNVPEHQKISKHDIKLVYNDCKESLGDLIVREIEEVEEFKRIIDRFKTDVLEERRKKLIKEEATLSEKADTLSAQYKKKMSVFDKEGKLRSLQISLHEQRMKNEEYSKIALLADEFEAQDHKKIKAQAERENAISKFDKNKEHNQPTISEFQNKILEIHKYLYGNRKASFSIDIKEAKNPTQRNFVALHMKTDDYGSARTEHEKILIFDFALLFCAKTREKHPKLLIHDGAFEGVNEDTKFQLLNWLHERSEEEHFQYITTINRDSFEELEKNKKFSFSLEKYVRAEYTKDHRFLKTKYIVKTNNTISK